MNNTSDLTDDASSRVHDAMTAAMDALARGDMAALRALTGASAPVEMPKPEGLSGVDPIVFVQTIGAQLSYTLSAVHATGDTAEGVVAITQVDLPSVMRSEVRKFVGEALKLAMRPGGPPSAEEMNTQMFQNILSAVGEPDAPRTTVTGTLGATLVDGNWLVAIPDAIMHAATGHTGDLGKGKGLGGLL